METDICLHTLMRKVSLNQNDSFQKCIFLNLKGVKGRRWFGLFITI